MESLYSFDDVVDEVLFVGNVLFVYQHVQGELVNTVVVKYAVAYGGHYKASVYLISSCGCD